MRNIAHLYEILSEIQRGRYIAEVNGVSLTGLFVFAAARPFKRTYTPKKTKMKKIVCLILCACSVPALAQNLTKGLQACYPLDNNAQNYAPTGSSLDGTLSNVTNTTGHSGNLNTGYAFS